MRFKVTFKDGTIYSLYGQEYFADKAVFWRSHQTNLIGFSLKVCELGTPIEIEDVLLKNGIRYGNQAEFLEWFKRHQSSEADFGFGKLADRQKIINEILRRLSQIEIILKEEIQKLNKEPLNPWRVDGGYKQLEKASKLGVCSLKRINRSHPDLFNDDLLNILIDCFSVPIQAKIENETIISYSQGQHKNLEREKLIKFCKLNLLEMNRLKKAIKF